MECLKIETITPGDEKVPKKLIFYFNLFLLFYKRTSHKRAIKSQFIMLEHFQMEINLIVV